MPTGFQSIGDDGNYQIDSSFASLALVRSGSLASQQYTNGSTTNTSPTRVAITLNSDEILAIACTDLCALGSLVGNTAYVYVSAAAGRVVEYFIFKPGSAGMSSSGMQVFNEVGSITFDSGWKLFDVRHIFEGYGSVSLPAGRQYAFVHSQIGTQVSYNRVVNGIPPNSLVSYIRRTAFSCMSINGQTLVSQLANVDVAGTTPSPGNVPALSQTLSNNVTPQFLIIDVTGY